MSTIAKRTVSLPLEHAAYIDRLVASGSFALGERGAVRSVFVPCKNAIKPSSDGFGKR